MTTTVLITGGRGFLGRATARAFKQRGYRVVGLGHGEWSPGEALEHGFDAWHPAEVSLAALSALTERFDLVVHCAAASSVPFSLEQPHAAFRMTVQCTVDLLEYLRISGSKALVLYPSSAAVYGATDDRPLRESDQPNPVSPYGFHKRMVEELLACYAAHFGVRAAVIRFFSIYGAGLARQLLWDACTKLTSAQGPVTFWGTGEETRDWIHVDDAAALIARVSETGSPFSIVNGAGGERITVRTALHMLRDALGVDAPIDFNGVIKAGDPRFYHADVTRARLLGAQPSVSLADGLSLYAQWFKSTWSK